MLYHASGLSILTIFVDAVGHRKFGGDVYRVYLLPDHHRLNMLWKDLRYYVSFVTV